MKIHGRCTVLFCVIRPEAAARLTSDGPGHWRATKMTLLQCDNAAAYSRPSGHEWRMANEIINEYLFQ